METEYIEFSLAAGSKQFWRDFAQRLCDKNPGLTFNQSYSCINGGVTVILQFTGKRSTLAWIKRRYGYGY